MTNGWTGGQYSLVRIVLATYLLTHFIGLVPWGAEVFSNRGVLPDASASPLIHLFPNVLAWLDSPAAVTALLLGAILCSLLLGLGLWDRWAAVGVWYVLACLGGRNPLTANPSLPYVGAMLLAHALLPSRPYGSWAGRGSADAGSAWRMPASIFTVVWVLMAVGYSFSGSTKLISPSWVDGSALARVLDNPLARPGAIRDGLLALPPSLLRALTWSGLGLELAFAPLALVRGLRPWLWSAMLAMHLALLVVVDFADLTLGMVMLHLFTFDPAWVAPRRAAGPEMMFYDGACGLCHRLVRFVLSEDRAGDAFRFAPLGGATAEPLRAAASGAELPDSVVVRTADGRLLVRSAAVVHIAGRLGGVWRILGTVAGLVPTGVRDGLYDRIARIRHRWFRRPASACPIVAADLRARFES